MKKLSILKQTVSKKIMTRPANNVEKTGCGKDFVSHAIIKQNFGGSTRDVTGEMAPFKMANVSNLGCRRLQKLHNRCASVIMRYKNEAGQSELTLRHLGWSLLRKRRIHIKA